MKARKLVLDEASVGKAGEIAVSATPKEWLALAEHLWLNEFDLTERSVGWQFLQVLKRVGIEAE